MKYSRYFTGLALAALGLAAIAPLASAGVGKDAFTGDIYATGYPPYAEIITEYIGIPQTRAYSANECGIVRVNLNALPLPSSFDGTAIPTTLSAIPAMDVANPPKCVNGVIANAPSGGIVRFRPNPDSDWNLMFTGKTPFVRYTAQWASGKERKVKANACGLIRLSNSGPYQGATGIVRIGSGNHTISSIPAFNAPPACRNNTLLTPAGFP